MAAAPVESGTVTLHLSWLTLSYHAHAARNWRLWIAIAIKPHGAMDSPLPFWLSAAQIARREFKGRISPRPSLIARWIRAASFAVPPLEWTRGRASGGAYSRTKPDLSRSSSTRERLPTEGYAVRRVIKYALLIATVRAMATVMADSEIMTRLF